MSTKTKAAETASSSTATGDDDRIERLYDLPQDQWAVEQWRALAYYLSQDYAHLTEDYIRLVAALEDATSLATDRLAINKKASVHSKTLRLLEAGLRDGLISIKTKTPRKKSGAPKKLSAEQERAWNAALVVMAARSSPSKAAEWAARVKMKKEGLDPLAHPIKLKRYTKTMKNKIAPARRWVRQEVLAEDGLSLAGYDKLAKLKLLATKAKAKPPNNRK